MKRWWPTILLWAFMLPALVIGCWVLAEGFVHLIVRGGK